MASRIFERVGEVAGIALAPLTASISAVRRARMFHPRGTLLIGTVAAVADEDPWRSLAERLEGRALVRLSSAWWKTREWPDVLGCAIRFTHAEAPSAVAGDDDQDLLFATIRRPWTTALAPLTTEHHDFFANDYYAVSPFDVGVGQDVEFRLQPTKSGHGRDREERLRAAVTEGNAGFELQARPYRRAIDPTSAPWRAIATVTLERFVDDDPPALRFDPFHVGRGIRPVGFVHALRLAAYRASQRARGASERLEIGGRETELASP